MPLRQTWHEAQEISQNDVAADLAWLAYIFLWLMQSFFLSSQVVVSMLVVVVVILLLFLFRW